MRSARRSTAPFPKRWWRRTAWRPFGSAQSLWSPAPADPEDVAHNGPPDRQLLWSRYGPRGIHRDLARTAAAASPRTIHTTSLGANALVSTPTAALIPLDLHFAEIDQHHTMLREPTVECQCVPCLDVNDARCVLLVDQRCDKRTKMTYDGTSSTANERRGALIRFVP